MPVPATNLAARVLGMLVVLSTAGCAGREEKSVPSPNAQLLEEVTRAGSWFHARRVRPI